MTIITYIVSFECTAKIFLDRGKNIARWQQPSTPMFDSLPYPYLTSRYRVVTFFAKIRDDPTISCSHLVAETSVLASQENSLEGSLEEG